MDTRLLIYLEAPKTDKSPCSVLSCADTRQRDRHISWADRVVGILAGRRHDDGRTSL